MKKGIFYLACAVFMLLIYFQKSRHFIAATIGEWMMLIGAIMFVIYVKRVR